MVIFLLLSGGYLILGINRVQMDIPALIYTEYAENYKLHNQKTTVHVDGIIYNSIFWGEKYSGRIWVDNYEKNMSLPSKKIYDIDNTMLLYSYGTEYEHTICYVSIDSKASILSLTFPGGVSIFGSTDNDRNVESILSDIIGNPPIEYSNYTFMDFVYSDKRLSFESKGLEKISLEEIESKSSDKNSIVLNSEKISLYHVPLYLYFQDINMAVDQVEFRFVNESLTEIKFKMYFQDLTSKIETYHYFIDSLDSELKETRKQVYNNVIYYEDSWNKDLIVKMIENYVQIRIVVSAD